MRLIALILLLCFQAIVIKPTAIHLPSDAYAQHSLQTMFRNFIALHRKNYANGEETAKRFEIFKANLEYIKSLNEKYNGTTTFGITQFADYTPEELEEAGMNLPQQYVDEEKIPYAEHINVDLPVPTSFDWRDQSKVSPVKNQGKCNACWAFAVIGALESLFAIKTNVSTELSTQELIDCDKGSKGCISGLVGTAYGLAVSKGLYTEQQYPYKGVQLPTCPPQDGDYKVKSFKRLPMNNDTVLASHVYNHGPVSVSFKSVRSFLHYWGGVFYPTKLECDAVSAYHSVVIVGFGVSGKEKYWIVKNSWGTTWGEEGYARFIRGGSVCDIETFPFSATV